MKKLIFIAVLLLVSCTENVRAKKFGGSMTIAVPVGNKVTNITWKEGDLWYSYRPFIDGETPQTQTFVEQSNYGILEGKVTFIEQK